jgi:hypothetical protein
MIFILMKNKFNYHFQTYLKNIFELYNLFLFQNII